MMIVMSRGVESDSPGVLVLARSQSLVAVCHLKETPTPEPLCHIGTYV